MCAQLECHCKCEVVSGCQLYSRVSLIYTELSTLSLPGSCCSVPSLVLNDSLLADWFSLSDTQEEGGQWQKQLLTFILNPGTSFSTCFIGSS